MTLPRWDDEMKLELARLKAELKVENFRVLHDPLGLGQVTKKQETRFNAKIIVPLTAKPVEKDLHEYTPFHEPIDSSFPTDDLSASQISRSLSKVFIIHALDVAFVLMTIGLGLLLATWVIDPQHVSENPELLRQATPLKFLATSNAFALVLGLYGFFSLYWLFFKLLTGSTLGESFLDNFWSLQNPPSRPSGKGSGDS